MPNKDKPKSQMKSLFQKFLDLTVRYVLMVAVVNDDVIVPVIAVVANVVVVIVCVLFLLLRMVLRRMYSRSSSESVSMPMADE